MTSAPLSKLTGLFAEPNNQTQGGYCRELEFVDSYGELRMRLSWEIVRAPLFQGLRFSPLVATMLMEMNDEVLNVVRRGELDLDLTRNGEVIGTAEWYRHHRGKLKMQTKDGRVSEVEVGTAYSGFLRGSRPAIACRLNRETFAYVYGYDFPSSLKEKVPFLIEGESVVFPVLDDSEQYCAILSALLLVIMYDFRTANYSSG